jgi:hypothetical protein
VSGPASIVEGGGITVSAAGSDPDGDDLSYSWVFDDGSTAAGTSVSRTFADDGAHTATVTVTDGRGGTATATHEFTVGNAAPVVDAGAGATVLIGDVFTGAGSFSDPGTDSWTASVDYGDATGAAPLVLSGSGFALSHRFAVAGSFGVSVTVTDDDGGAGTGTLTVRVLSISEWLDLIIANVRALGLSAGNTNSLVTKLLNAEKSLDKGNTAAALGQIGAFRNELAAFVRTGRIAVAAGAEIDGMVARAVAGLTP